MVIDRSDNLYVSDGDSIFKFTADGNKSTFTTGIDAFEMVIDRSGNLYFSEGDSIFKFTPEGKRARSPLGLAPLRAWPLTERAISLWRNKTATRSSNLAPMQPRAPSPPGSGLLTWPLTVWAICLCGMRESQSILKFTPDGTKSTFARSGSPDQKWEYVGGDDPKIVKAGTNEVALDLSDGLGGLVWAPDSKRFAAYSGGGGRCHTTSLYQLRGDQWKALKSPEDELGQ